MKILITGLSGFLGSQLANALVTEYDLAGAIRSSSKLDRINCKSEITLINVENDKWIEDVKKFNPSIVINTAALYGRKNESLSELIDANIVFPQKIIECMGADTVFVNCGTSLPSSVSLYAQTKNLFVDLAKEYCKSNRIKFLNLRLEHFFGANDDSTKFTSYVIHQCLANRPLKLTKGTQERDFLYIEDLISAFRCIIDSVNKLESFENIDIGSGCAITIRGFVELVVFITASTSIIEFGAVPMREHELMHSCADTHRIKSLGWCLHYPLANAIVDMIIKENK
ncbi:NAD-dependent epimerase/dehydratase family protein [Aeromonas veronii]|uniref:NAD-dependent epimerase/dehydratase family protein n=1 Tax=Aeromonas veronii TaxID=654 RepID=UPI001F3CE2F6|nr:NAD-dependent epimerase/dehydratase [Aeromonas veronii]MCF5846480.1 NAD-dependent epimerase/dehydratase [Aeromonas veronii]MCF5879472.1 NAD-dependent epimerase/dehydratase [Aeromonas veronii]MCF5899644.1 NAD-dependent epimerase/dehydratase [Aeromonas veronii]